jgi:hypothetical protein
MEAIMKSKKVLGTAVLISMLSSGCATILSDDEQKINVTTSNGKSIQVEVDGRTFDAPGIIEVKRENKDKVLVTKSDSCVKEVSMNKKVAPVFFVNILGLGVFGSSTDYGTQKMWSYQDTVSVNCH